MPSLLPNPTGIPTVDALSGNASPSIDEYIQAVSDYVLGSQELNPGQKKTAQIQLSAALARCLREELRAKVPSLDAYAGERTVAGALREVQADVSKSDPLDGLRLAVELKPVNLAVGRAIWNRFGDIRTFAVNIHLKFPFAVVGGVLAIPTWEWHQKLPGERVSTIHLVNRLVRRLQRTPLRDSEADAPHLLEAVSVIVYDPNTGQMHPDLPPVDSPLRWNEFVNRLADAYDLRFL